MNLIERLRHNPGSRRALLEGVRILALLTLVTLIWCGTYNRWTVRAWNTPIVYGGDASWGMAAAKAMADGEIAPIVTKDPVSLGAPFRANWNDYPSIEEGLTAWWALLVRLFGLFLGSNLVLLAAHLLAFLSFYYVCRALRYSVAFAAAGAVLFACSRFAFARSLQHLGLTYYWHIPLGILVAWYCFRRGPLHTSRQRLWFCLIVALLHGIQNIYYTGIFCQFLAAAVFYHGFVRHRWKRTLLPLLLIGIMAVLFVLMNADTFAYQWIHGPNPNVLVRNYAGLELYALKPIELFLPTAHRLVVFHKWAVDSYFLRSYSVGEPGSAYLGVIGVFALLLLGFAAIRAVIQHRLKAMPSHVWSVLWIFAFSIVGGINGILGLFGLIFFRCTNRYSIVILTLVLLFLVRELTRLTRRWRSASALVLATLITLVGCYDQTPLPPPGDYYIAAVREDAYIASQLRAKLGHGAMIFQLPVAEFPEVPAIGEMTDYEHFRPYLQSRGLRFSYGSDKGRTRERWQAEAVSLGMPGLVKILETYGFSGILINRRAYADNGNALISQLQAAGRQTVLVDVPREFGIALNPAPRPILPPDFDSHWYRLEGTAKENRRWSSGNAKITFENGLSIPRTIHLSFLLETLKRRQLRIVAERKIIYQAQIEPTRAEEPVQLSFVLPPGQLVLHVTSDVPAGLPPNGDQRKLAFSVANFELTVD
jgi:hypothetical protein